MRSRCQARARPVTLTAQITQPTNRSSTSYIVYRNPPFLQPAFPVSQPVYVPNLSGCNHLSINCWIPFRGKPLQRNSATAASPSLHPTPLSLGPQITQDQRLAVLPCGTSGPWSIRLLLPACRPTPRTLCRASCIMRRVMTVRRRRLQLQCNCRCNCNYGRQ